MKISLEESKNIYGGDGFGIFAGISSAIAFLIGIIDGFISPKGCER